MSPKVLECVVKSAKELFLIESPTVGRAILLVREGQPVVGGQFISDLFRLNSHFHLTVPSDCYGRIAQIKNRDRIINLGYGEVFLTLDRSLDQKDEPFNDKAKEKLLGSDFIACPMDGMFYLSPSPESPPFVKVGDEVAPGQTLGLIEVMKCFYPLKFQGNKSARVTGISVKNATPVTSGTTLYVIERIL